MVLVPVSGGGLLSGVATALKLRNPKIKVIGVEPELAADTQASLRAGKRITWDAAQVNKTICDGLRTTPVGEIPFAHITRYVDDVVTVSEDEIEISGAVLSWDAVGRPRRAASPGSASRCPASSGTTA